MSVQAPGYPAGVQLSFCLVRTDFRPLQTGEVPCYRTTDSEITNPEGRPSYTRLALYVLSLRLKHPVPLIYQVTFLDLFRNKIPYNLLPFSSSLLLKCLPAPYCKAPLSCALMGTDLEFYPCQAYLLMCLLPSIRL